MRKESPPGPHQAGGISKPTGSGHLTAPEENGFNHYYSRYSCDLDTSSRDFSLDPGKPSFSIDGDWAVGRHYRFTKQNGHSHPIRSPFYPDAMPQKSDYGKLPPDYHTYLESKGRSADEVASTVGSGVGSSGYYRASVGGSSSQDYRDTSVGTPSRASLHSEQINYPDSEWSYGGMRDEYEKRPKSSYVTQTSPTPAIRQRSRSGSGLQEPNVPYAASGTFRSPPQAHPYSSYTYPRLSESLANSQTLTKVTKAKWKWHVSTHNTSQQVCTNISEKILHMYTHVTHTLTSHSPAIPFTLFSSSVFRVLSDPRPLVFFFCSSCQIDGFSFNLLFPEGGRGCHIKNCTSAVSTSSIHSSIDAQTDR